jgi:peptide/nickel transport system permease protein
MAEQTFTPMGGLELVETGAQASEEKKAALQGYTRIFRYSLARMLMLMLTVVVGVYLTILIANMGGYVDNIRRGDIRETVMTQILQDRAIQALSEEARQEYIAAQIARKEKALGLDRPFVLRSFNFLTDALSLNLGRASVMTSDTGSRLVKLILLERIPPTLALFATANFGLFFGSVFLALYLSRRYGSALDKVIIALTPSSAAPGWFYGIFFILIFASVLRVLPFGGMVDTPPPEEPVTYALSVLQHMILPALSLTLSAIFLNIYSYRTFFLIYSSEDYVDMAKAKGLSSNEIERRYVLRPTLPTIITSFALTLIGMWTGAPILETVFNWPGLGRTLFRAVGMYETAVIVGETVIFSYLLAITVFSLDFIYAIVDPRVKIGTEGKRS